MNTKDIPYWMSLAHLPGWGAAKVNGLVVNFYHHNKIGIEEFFSMHPSNWAKDYGLTNEDISALMKSKTEMSGLAFLAEQLLNEGYEIIPIVSPEYSPSLKANLKASHSPVILYLKGNKQLLKENSIAIVGSRAAAEISLKFADNIARLASKEYKVVVSGFAKGVDKQALDSAIKYHGQSIIVLPQGILTFASGFNTYYKQIVAGDVAVISTFFPKSSWRKELAMARNPIIFGLANEIYVAESSEKGGTWSGVMDGLKKKRKIYVRKPEPGEINANNILITRGSIAVDFNGRELISNSDNLIELNSEANDTKFDELVSDNDQSIEKKLFIALNKKSSTAKELLIELNLTWTSQKLTSILKKLPQVEIFKVKNSNLFKLKENYSKPQKTLFE